MIKDFASRLDKETLNIANIDMATIVEAFNMGLKKDFPSMKIT